MGRRKKEANPVELTMKSETTQEMDTELEDLAGEETEQLETVEASEATVAPTPRKPRKPRAPRKKAEPAIEAATGEAAPTIATDATPAPAPTAPQTNPVPTGPNDFKVNLPPIESIPLSVTEAAITSRVLNQMTRQIDVEAASSEPTQLVKQLAAVKEVSVSICSQLDRMTATLIELQNKHAQTLQDLQKEKLTPKKNAAPRWLVGTAVFAVMLSVLSISLTQSTRHSILDAKNQASIPSHLLTGIARAEARNNPVTVPQTTLQTPTANFTKAAIAKKENSAQRQRKR
jgi:hypothetical protein